MWKTEVRPCGEHCLWRVFKTSVGLRSRQWFFTCGAPQTLNLTLKLIPDCRGLGHERSHRAGVAWPFKSARVLVCRVLAVRASFEFACRVTAASVKDGWNPCFAGCVLQVSGPVMKLYCSSRSCPKPSAATAKFRFLIIVVADGQSLLSCCGAVASDRTHLRCDGHGADEGC